MSEDYIINLLPSEYLPKPEFKAFPIFVILILAITGLYIGWEIIRLDNRISTLRFEKSRLEQEVNREKDKAMAALDLQARSRMLFSYGLSVVAKLRQNPPWIDVYNEIEESIPDGMWIESLKLVGGGERKWPSFAMVGMVAGNEPETVLTFYEQMLAKESRFEKVYISGYTFIKLDDQDAVTFNMRFSLKKSSFMGF